MDSALFATETGVSAPSAWDARTKLRRSERPVAATERKSDGRKTGRPAPEIPDKLYFRIGEVAKLLDLPAYVLRFWETEFPQLKPGKGGTGQRLYRRRDVETALEIRRLLYDEGYTIPGARQFLKMEPRGRREAPAPSPVATPIAVPVAAPAVEAAAKIAEEPYEPKDQRLSRIKSDLRELSSLLSRPPVAGPAAPGTRRAPNLRGLHVAPRRHAEEDGPPPLFAVPPSTEG